VAKLGPDTKAKEELDQEWNLNQVMDFFKMNFLPSFSNVISLKFKNGMQVHMPLSS